MRVKEPNPPLTEFYHTFETSFDLCRLSVSHRVKMQEHDQENMTAWMHKFVNESECTGELWAKSTIGARKIACVSYYLHTSSATALTLLYLRRSPFCLKLTPATVAHTHARTWKHVRWTGGKAQDQRIARLQLLHILPLHSTKQHDYSLYCKRRGLKARCPVSVIICESIRVSKMQITSHFVRDA